MPQPLKLQKRLKTFRKKGGVLGTVYARTRLAVLVIPYNQVPPLNPTKPICRFAVSVGDRCLPIQILQ